MRTIATNGLVSLTVESLNEGLHWLFTNDYGDSLSVVLHKGSYGSERGLFEIMPSWKTNESFGDNGVKGFCSFGEVQVYINTLKNITADKTKAETSTVKTIV